MNAKRRFLPLIALLVGSLVLMGYVLILLPEPTHQSYKYTASFPRPAPLYRVVEPVSLDKFLNATKDIFKRYNATLKLPTWLPDNCKPVAVWYKLPLVAIIAYDNRSISNYDEARITVEIALMRRDITKAKLLKSLQRWIEELRSRGRDAILIQLNGTYIVLVKTCGTFT